MVYKSKGNAVAFSTWTAKIVLLLCPYALPMYALNKKPRRKSTRVRVLFALREGEVNASTRAHACVRRALSFYKEANSLAFEKKMCYNSRRYEENFYLF